LVALLRKLFDFIGSGKVRCELFDGLENIPGAAARVTKMVVVEFPLVTPAEMTTLIKLLLAPRKMEEFEGLLAQFITRAKQTTPGETLRHLRLQRLKEALAE
jgi:hypothetical protein